MATELRSIEALTARVHRLHRDISRLQRGLLDTLTSLEDAARAELRELLRIRLPAEADGTIRLTARAWAVRGTRGDSAG